MSAQNLQEESRGSRKDQGRPRYVVLWVPNWPLASLVIDTPPETPAITIQNGRVSVVTPAAKKQGVRRSMTRSLAQYHCPNLMVFTADEERESAAFEPLLEIFDRVAASVNVIRPGLAFAPALGAAKWVGSEERLVEQLIDDVAVETGAECQVGVGSGLSVAMMAAHRGIVVPAADTRRFLDGLSLAELACELPSGVKQAVYEVLEVLKGLGVSRAKEFRDLGKSAVVSRFGAVGEILWQLTCGEDPHFDVGERGARKVEAAFELDPPAELIEHAATAIARVSADLADGLQQRSLYSSTVQVILETESGRTHERTWTLLDATSGRQVSKRITWQLRGWLDGRAQEEVQGSGASDGLKSLKVIALSPRESPEADPLWGSVRASWKVGQAVEEVQDLLGESSVVTPNLHGGFDPRTRVSLTPWGLVSGPVPPLEGAWEGAIEDPPVILFADPPSAMLLGERKDGTLGRLWVGRRGMINGVPRQLVVSKEVGELRAGDYPLLGLERLWVVRGRWWQRSHDEHGARCYLRVKRVDGTDLLLVQRKGEWKVEGVYGGKQ